MRIASVEIFVISIAAALAGPAVLAAGPPRLTALSLSSSSADVSRGPASISVNVSAADDSARVSYLEVVFADQSGTFEVKGSSAFDADPSVSKRLTVSFPQTGPPGQWTLRNVFLADEAGNTTLLSTHDLVDLGFATIVTIVTLPDHTPPHLTTFGISPSSIDTTSGPGVVHAGFRAEDDMSGVRQFQVSLVSPSGSLSVSGAVSFLSSTTAESSAEITLPQYTESGLWTVGGVFISDAAGNTLALKRADLSAYGFSTEVSVVSARDVTPPRLKAVTFTQSVDTTHGPAEAQVAFVATDDGSGITDFEISFVSPSGADTLAARAHLTSTANANGSVTLVFPQASESGSWTVGRILLQDAAGNTEISEPASLASSGLPSALMVKSERAPNRF